MSWFKTIYCKILIIQDFTIKKKKDFIQVLFVGIADLNNSTCSKIKFSACANHTFPFKTIFFPPDNVSTVQWC